MVRLVADVNIEGHVDRLVLECQTEEWRYLWAFLDVEILTFEGLGLPRNAPDRVLWTAAQSAGAVLLTANRNRKGQDSLEATIEAQNTLDALPVITLADPDRFRIDAEYRHEAVEAFPDYLLEIDRYRGAGRLYIP